MNSARVLLVAFACLAAACSSANERNIGDFRIVTGDDGKTFAVHHGERLLLESAPVAAQRLRFDGGARMNFGRFTFDQEVTSETALEGVAWDGDALVIGGALRLTPHVEEGRLRFDVGASGTADGWRLRFACAPHADFMGFGQQFSFLTLKGHRVPLWVEENGLGRSETPIPPLGSLYSSYYPMPYFLDPRGMGFVSDSPAYQVYDLCAAEPQTWAVEIWDTEPFALHVLPGPTPMDVVTQIYALNGAPSNVPDWGWDLWLAAQGGPDAVRAVLDAADAADIDYSAVWVQDWLGRREFGSGTGFFGVKYRWQEDADFYPDLKGLIAETHARGKKLLGYFNPFIPPAYEFFAEGAANGWLVTDLLGEPLVFTMSTFDTGLVDLTHPGAVAWFESYAKRAVTELGFDGWMSDFGEWLPWDAKVHAGAAPKVHNVYPTLWHAASRRVLDAEKPGDYVLFTRSGWLRDGAASQIVWVGDQEATWDKHDGIPTAVKAMVSLSLSGVPFVTHDIAGFSGGPSTPELWMRWVELGTFSPIMRIHDGLRKYENWSFQRDATSTTFLMAFSKMRTRIKPYLVTLAAEALATGRPMVRHPLLVEGIAAASVDDQFFLGDDLLVAPVLTEGATSRTVRFPPGRWRPLYQMRQPMQGPAVLEWDAPVGQPAVFAREGSEIDRLTFEPGE